jgi:hypothetical protein
MSRMDLIAKAKPITFPGVNGMAVCDCGSTIFSIGMERDALGNNHIRCLECSNCGHQLAVPFFDDATKRQPHMKG